MTTAASVAAAASVEGGGGGGRRNDEGDHSEMTTKTKESPLTTLGYAFAASIRTIVVGLKRGALAGYIRRKNFIRLGTLSNKSATLSSSTSTSTMASSASSSPSARNALKERVKGFVDFAKMTLMSLAVFGTYEYVAFSFFPNQHRRLLEQQQNENQQQHEVEKVLSAGVASSTSSHPPSSPSKHYHRSEEEPVWAHAIAGIGAGIAQSAILTLFELTFEGRSPWHQQGGGGGGGGGNPPWRRWFHSFGGGFLWKHPLAYVNRRTVHHALGYGILFGTYEGLRRLFDRIIITTATMTTADHKKEKDDDGDDGSLDAGMHLPTPTPVVSWYDERLDWIWRRPQEGVDDVTLATIASSALAGGFAGQSHVFVSHFTRNWVRQKGATTTTTTPIATTAATTTATTTRTKISATAAAAAPPSSSSSSSSSHSSLRVALRSAKSVFLPASAVFLAFEFGGDLTEACLEQFRPPPPPPPPPPPTSSWKREEEWQ